MLQYGNLNVTDPFSSRQHHDEDHTNIIHHNNKGRVYHQRHKSYDDISASPQLTLLPNMDEKCVIASKQLETSTTSLPFCVSQEQPVPPVSMYHSLIPTDATRGHISWNHSQHQQQNPEMASTVPQQAVVYQGSGPTSSPNPQHTTMQYGSDPELKGKRVFILHYVPAGDDFIQAVESLATSLREIGVDVSIDLFEKDPGTVENWSIWYEDEILSSKIVLCIITPNFNSNIKKVSLYNLMSNRKDIAFRAVFLDFPRVTEYIPFSMQGSTSYCISSQCLSLDNEDFANLYALLTGQNRVERPPIGPVVHLPPKISKCKYMHYCVYHL